MAVCQYCGIDSPGDSRFCGVCGRPFTNEYDASTSRSSTNSQVPPPPPPILQRSSVPAPYPQGNGPSFIAPVTPSNVPPPPPPSGMLNQPLQPPTIRQSYPGQTSGSGQQPPTIRQSFPGTSGLSQQPPTIRQSFPSSGGTPPPNASVNNQSPMFLPPANSGETYNTPNMGNSSQYDGGNQKLQQKKRSSGLRILTFAIVLVIVLIGGVGSVLAYAYLHNKPASNGAVVATATPAPTAAATLAPTANPQLTHSRCLGDACRDTDTNRRGNGNSNGTHANWHYSAESNTALQHPLRQLFISQTYPCVEQYYARSSQSVAGNRLEFHNYEQRVYLL